MPIKTLEQIDAELEKEYFSDKDIEENSTEEVELVEIETADETDTEDQEVEEVEDVKKVAEPTEKKVDKQEFAWKELRTKNQQLQQELEEKQKAIAKLEEMAKGLGYGSSHELLKRYEDEQTTKEAETKGVDPKFYKEFKEIQQELQLNKKQKEEQNRNLQIQKFTESLDSLAAENGLTELEKQQIIQELELDGYTLEDIVTIKSPKRLLTGYMVDKIAERKVQSKLKQQKKEAFVDEKHTNNAEVTENDLEKTIAEEMKQYARSMGYKT
jgi:hypothetical protein